jgi:glycosyltransferase involved in cell wall biosynthesis
MQTENTAENILINKKTALVHDWLTTFGGAERVVALWKEIFPEAPLYTTVYNEKNLGKIFPKEFIRTSYLQKLPGVLSYYRKLLSFMPRAFEDFNFDNFDIVLSSSSSCAKGVLTSSSTFHVSYIHSPMRYAWDLYHEYLESSGTLTRYAMRRMMPGIRQWDLSTANRVDLFLCNSREVARRIRKVYRREALVVHPPIETGFFTPADPEEQSVKGSEMGERYLVLTRLVPYKRVDLAVKACTKASKPLDVIGTGPELKKLKAIAGKTVRFRGFLNDDEIRESYRSCRAMLFPGFEDFGMTPLEAQACGRPVLAFGKGGALETIKDGRTGLFFSEQTVEALQASMEDFESRAWNPKLIRRHAETFSRSAHIEKLLHAISTGYTDFIK